MALQNSGSITARDIANELGYTQGASTKIGDYRLSGGQNFGGVRLPVSENVPTSGQIKFSDFYEARRTLVVNYYSTNENKPQNARNRFTSRSKLVVGNFVGNNNNTSGKKVIILVNKDIGSNKSAQNSCALRTGNWNSNTVLEVLVGPNGEIIGAGGNGGNGGGATGGSGGAGGDGSSGLGVQYEGTGGTRVTIQSGGRIAGGGGGGGGGGGAFVEREEWRGGPRQYAGGSGGGGAAGLPSGNRGNGGGNGGSNGTNGSKTTGGVGGATNTQSGGDYGARGGAGGNAGNLGANGANGANGSGFGRIEGSPRFTGGRGARGLSGAAIRRNSGFNVVIQNLGPPSQLVGSTSATGIT